MKQVDVIRPGGINAIIGPVGTLKRILKNQDYFNQRGYDVTLFTNDSLTIGPIKEVPSTPIITGSSKNNLRNRLGSFLRMHAKSNRMIARWLLKKDYKKTEALVNYYLTLDRNPDIIQFHSNLECQLYLQNRKDRKAKTMLFLHTDGIPFKMMLQYYPCLEGTTFMKKLQDDLAYTVSLVDHIVFIARIGQINFLKYFPNRSLTDTSVIINGIDDLTDEQKKEVAIIRQAVSGSSFKFRLCCTGTINTRKGHRIIIEALHHMNEDLLKQVHVDFLGEGGERVVLEALVHEYGLEEHISFLGLVPNSDVYRYLAQNNIYILMSKNEGLPISIIEAMRAGLPVISTNVSGIPELVEVGSNGVLLNPDADELTALLNRLPEFDWGEMGQNSRNRFETEFTFERMEKEFCDRYDLLIS